MNSTTSEIILSIIGIIGFIVTVYSLYSNTKAQTESTQQEKLKLTLDTLKQRQELINGLKELFMYVRGYTPWLMGRWTQPTRYTFDKNQPAFADNRQASDIPNAFYQTVLLEFKDKRAEIGVWFPTLLQPYDLFIELAVKTQGSIKYHKESISVKSWDEDLAKKMADAFDHFIALAEANMIQSPII